MAAQRSPGAPLQVAAARAGQLAEGVGAAAALDGVADLAGFEQTLRDLGLKPHITVVAADSSAAAEAKATSLVFTTDDAMRQHFADAGFETGLIVSSRDIDANFPI